MADVPHHRPRHTQIAESMKDNHLIESWMSDAACVGKPLYWWFPRRFEWDEPQTFKALAICNSCPVKQQCLDWAMQRTDQHGIYGGLLPDERKQMMKDNPARKAS